jgi:7-cyano-7-deazaguanine synthase
MNHDSALVLFSGGQDSTTCLAWALSHYQNVETIGFSYGQRHAVELEARIDVFAQFQADFPKWSTRLGEDHVVDLTFLADIGETAMTEEVEIALGEDGLPNTFVPGRNLLFFTVAAAVAHRRGIRHLVGGMCETDFSGYPDCRDDTLKALQATLNLGMNTRFIIDTPLMWLDKAATWSMAEALGGERLVNIIRERTHTCYMGIRNELYEWGYGCGSCPACKLRWSGYETYTHQLER